MSKKQKKLLLALAVAGLAAWLSVAAPAAADAPPEFGLSSFRALIEDVQQKVYTRDIFRRD